MTGWLKSGVALAAMIGMQPLAAAPVETTAIVTTPTPADPENEMAAPSSAPSSNRQDALDATKQSKAKARPAKRKGVAADPAPVAVQDGRLTLERIEEGGSLAGSAPTMLIFSPDGKRITYLKPRADERERSDLWSIDPVTGQERMLIDTKLIGGGSELSEAEKMQRERLRLGGSKGLISYQWTPDGRAILAPLNGELLLVSVGGSDDGKVTRLPASANGALNPTVSRRGTALSFVKDGALFVAPLGDGAGAPRQITDKGTDTVSWGVAEFVAQEEMHRMTGHWWSPDDRLIAVARVDDSPVGIVSRAAIGADGTKVFNQRYPKAGTPNAIVDLYVMRPDGSGKVKVDLGSNRDIYLARVNWSRDGKMLYIQRQDRLQKRIDLLAADPLTGKTWLVFADTQKNFTNLSDDFQSLADGSLLWTSEKSGYRHIYHIKDGKWRALTSGKWEVNKIAAVDEPGDRIYFIGNRETPLEPQLYWTSLSKGAGTNGAGITRVTEPGFSNSATLPNSASSMIVTRSSTMQPPQVYLADRDGKIIKWVAENIVAGNHPYAPYMARHLPTEFGTIKAKDGTPLYYSLIKPANMEAGKRYPVYISHYGGPSSRQVGNQWGKPLHQYYAQNGWVVFTLDNRGSPDRGKAFEDQIYRKMGGVEVEDQMTGAAWLKKQPFVDPDRMAIYGWSYGGYMTLKLLEAAPKGFYAAGISGAPVTQWELYDTHYTERYMGLPTGKDGKAAYDKASALPDAANINTPMLLIHGMADDNVVFDNATALMARLQRASVPFETMLYPGQTHRVGGPGVGLHMQRTMEAFLNRTVKDKK